MGTIGYTATTGGGRGSRFSSNQYDVAVGYSYTPSVDEELDQAFIDTEGNTSDASVEVGVVKVDTGEVVATIDFFITASAPRQVVSATYPAGAILEAGVEYAHFTGSAAQTTSFFVYRTGESAGDNERVAESGYPAGASVTLPGTPDTLVRHTYSTTKAADTTPTIRKSSTFDIETTLGTITTATLNSVNVFDHVTGQVGTTVSFEGAATDEITTSGEYTLTLGDGATTEDITVQVNVVGVAPSNNPLQKDGAALASLTGVQVRVTDGANLNGTQLEYTATATTDASGNLGNIDLSSTAAAVDDSVLLHMLTAAGDSIISDETVGLI